LAGPILRELKGETGAGQDASAAALTGWLLTNEK
jgi:hypothetical protein